MKTLVFLDDVPIEVDSYPYRGNNPDTQYYPVGTWIYGEVNPCTFKSVWAVVALDVYGKKYLHYPNNTWEGKPVAPKRHQLTLLVYSHA